MGWKDQTQKLYDLAHDTSSCEKINTKLIICYVLDGVRPKDFFSSDINKKVESIKSITSLNTGSTLKSSAKCIYWYLFSLYIVDDESPHPDETASRTAFLKQVLGSTLLSDELLSDSELLIVDREKVQIQLESGRFSISADNANIIYKEIENRPLAFALLDYITYSGATICDAQRELRQLASAVDTFELVRWHEDDSQDGKGFVHAFLAHCFDDPTRLEQEESPWYEDPSLCDQLSLREEFACYTTDDLGTDDWCQRLQFFVEWNVQLKMALRGCGNLENWFDSLCRYLTFRPANEEGLHRLFLDQITQFCRVRCIREELSISEQRTPPWE